MSPKIKSILERYIEELKSIYGTHLKAVILYGSYARGDFRSDSDIDIMILLDVQREKIEEYRHQLSEATYDIYMDEDVDIQPMAENIGFYEKWNIAHPFYANVRNEGVSLYAA